MRWWRWLPYFLFLAAFAAFAFSPLSGWFGWYGRPPGGWGAARQIAGPARPGAASDLTSVSCASAGNCTAVGIYDSVDLGTDNPGPHQPMVVTEVRGTWQRPSLLPFPAASADSMISTVSCASPGNCTAGGFYTTSAAGSYALVVSQVNGTWQRAQVVPGTSAPHGHAEVTSLSCASPGNCTALGTPGSPSGGSFAAAQVNGTWQHAQVLPGQLDTVSCAAAGSCTAGGELDGQAVVASEVSGRWQPSAEVPGIAALNLGRGRPEEGAEVTSVSCASPGNCAAGGLYHDGSSIPQAFVATEVNGRWQRGAEVPGTAALNQGTDPLKGAGLSSVACPSPGDCSAGGYYTDRSGKQQVFVASEVSGSWRMAEQVPGSAAMNDAPGDPDEVGTASIAQVSCASAGNCAAGGRIGGRGYGLVARQVGGKWQKAGPTGLPAGIEGGRAGVQSVSCVPGGCTAVGSSPGRDDNGTVAYAVSTRG